MKKLLKMLMCSTLVLGVTGCVSDEVKKEEINPNKFSYTTTFEDGRNLRMTFEVKYKDEYLTKLISENKLTLKDLKDNMEQLYILREGGSALYKYNKDHKVFGDKDFYMMSCNSLEGYYDTFISYDKEYISGLCSFRINKLDKVKMEIIEDNASNNGLTVKINDSSKNQYLYGEDYRILKSFDGFYHDIDVENELSFNSIGYTNKNDLVFKIDWSGTYGKLSKGKYRLLKKVIDTETNLDYLISVEFEVK